MIDDDFMTRPPADCKTTVRDDAKEPWDDDANCVLAAQPATYVFLDCHNQIVIRQRCWPDDDMFVIIAPEGVTALIDALRDATDIGSRTDQPMTSRRSPAAERQARHRERKRECEGLSLMQGQGK